MSAGLEVAKEIEIMAMNLRHSSVPVEFEFSISPDSDPNPIVVLERKLELERVTH